MSEIKVNSIKGVSASSAAISINNTDGTCTANITNNLSNRRLTINGAMTIAQRGTSSTTNGYGTVDRWQVAYGDTDEAITQSQVDVASGTTPYSLGFRKALRATNGNQTSGAGAGDFVFMIQKIEAQDIATSGWNYTDSNSFVTFSFWVKSSVAQNFYGYIRSGDGTQQNYAIETGTLTANTWTKITKVISGNSNLQIDNDNGTGLLLFLSPFTGTTYTDSGVTLNQWAAYATGTRMPDFASTWYTTNDATFEITGVQLEVGSVATDFEHRLFGQELALCERYFEICRGGITTTGVNSGYIGNNVTFSVKKRTTPTITRISDYQIGNVNTPYSDLVDINGFTSVAQHDGSGNMKFSTKYSADAEL